MSDGPVQTATWRALLVDDERLARKRLTALLAAHPEVKVVGEARDLAAARALVDELAPDLVFLDIQLSPGNGFDLLPHLPAGTEVIFVTAYDTFAVRAFEANALDYLLKPVLPARLATSLQRLRRPQPPAGSREDEEASSSRRLGQEDQLVLRDGRIWHRVEVSKVVAILGEGSYTRLLIAEGGSILTLKTMAHWSDVLPENAFARLSRSVSVNLARVRRCRFIDRNLAEVWLDGQEHPLKLKRVGARQLRRLWRGPE